MLTEIKPAQKFEPIGLSDGPKVYIETYGCQMNVSDSEVVVSLLQKEGYHRVENMEDADLILINTCSIRENAEQRVRGRLHVFKEAKKKRNDILIGVIGCMAERLKEQLLEEEKMVDIVVGPDAYRDLPVLIRTAETGQKAVNVLLSREETYADISPVRLDKNGVTAFVSIMRGCDNMCAFCVVPYTRGRERSRDPESIKREVLDLIGKGYKEVTLLGQNVDSYNWNSDGKMKLDFADLLEMVAQCSSQLRVRFSTSHPKDMTDKVLHVMAAYPNICDYIHLPAQSGSTKILKDMKRGYTREWYIEKVNAIRKIIPGCAVSTDIIAGFCGESEDDHMDTLSLMRWAQYDFAYMFMYSERPNTFAQKKFKDDVPQEVKSRRLTEIIQLQNKLSEASHKKDIGKVYEVLVEGLSKKSDQQFFGRNSQNKVVVFPRKSYKIGDYVQVEITSCTSATLIGKAVS
jgi:tRNA-2-methylthio-N6-dimethylallyladenosine synthase